METYATVNTELADGTVGIVGLPELAAALSDSGLRVITGEDFHKAAIAIRDEISSTGHSFPVLISDVKAPTKRAWANRISGDTSLFIIKTDTEDPISCDGAIEVPTPTSASSLLTIIDRIQFAAKVDGLMIDADGSISGANGGKNDFGFTIGADIDEELEALMNADYWDSDDDVVETNQVTEVQVESDEDEEDFKDRVLTDFMDDTEEDFEETENSFPQEPEVVRASSVPDHLNSMDDFNNFSRQDDPWGDDDSNDVAVQNTPAHYSSPVATEAPVRRERPSSFTAPVQPVHEPAPYVTEPTAVPVQRERFVEAPVRRERPSTEQAVRSDRRERPDAVASVAPVRRERVAEEHTAPVVTPERERAVITQPARRERPSVNQPSRRERTREVAPVSPFEDDASPAMDDDDELFIPAAIFAGKKAEPELPVRRTHNQPVPEPEVQFHVEEEQEIAYEEYEDNSYEQVVFEPETPYIPVAAPPVQETVAITGTTPLLFCWGSKGGVGKTTVAMSVAQRAARAGLRVVLIDGNRGQGDIRTYLGLNNKDMSSVLDVALGHPIKEALYGTKAIAERRNAPKMNPATGRMEAPKVKLNDIRFGLVLAPKARTADPSLVTGAVYNRVINSVRGAVDLVIVDTQTIEVFDTSGLVNSTIIPGLVGGGWSLAITDLNVTGTSNLRDQLEHFSNAGVPKERTFTLINRVNDIDSPNCQNVGKLLGRFSNHLGAIAVDESVTDSMNLGNVPELSEEATALIDAALYKITQNEKFNTSVEAPTATAANRGKLFQRKASK